MAVALTIKIEEICNTFATPPIKMANKVFLFKPMSVTYSFKGKLGEEIIKKQFDLWDEACEWIRNADFTSLTFEGISYNFGFTSPVKFELCRKEGDECKLHVPAKITTVAQYAPTRERYIQHCTEFVMSRFKEIPDSLPVHIENIDDFYLTYPVREPEESDWELYPIKLAQPLTELIEDKGENNHWLNKLRKFIGYA